MMKPLLKNKGFLLTISLLGAAGIIAIITVASRTPRASVVPPLTSSTAQAVDTSISLSSSAVPSPSTQSPSSPERPRPPASMGCKLDLRFTVTGGNLGSAGNMQYHLEAKNLGNTTCASPSISIYYANGENHLSSNPPATADGYYWRLHNLAPGAGYDITLATNRSMPLAAGAAVDEACLSAYNGVDACSDPSTNNSGPSITPPKTALVVPASEELGVWIWTPVSKMSTAEMEQYVSEAAANHFNAIYLTIDDYLDLTNLPAGPDKQQALSLYNQSLEHFIDLANQKGLSVDAEAGWRDWAEPENTSKAIRMMVFVMAFNESHAKKFRGVQYDIEPYLLPQYQSDQAGTLINYVRLLENLVIQNQERKLPLTIVIPNFYTATQQWTPEITVDGITDYTYNHIVRLLDKLPGSRVIVMAYRNFVSGPNGSITLSTPEIQYADNSHVKVLVAQETGPVQPSYVTFNSLSRSDLFAAIEAIDQSFASNPSFAGVSINYLDTFLSLP